MAVAPRIEPNERPSLIQRLRRALAERARLWAEQTLGETAVPSSRESGQHAPLADGPDGPPAAWLEYIRQRAPHLIVGGQFRPSSGGMFGAHLGADVGARRTAADRAAVSTSALSRAPSRSEVAAAHGQGSRRSEARTDSERGRPTIQARTGTAPVSSSAERRAALDDDLWPRGRGRGAALRTINRSRIEIGEQSPTAPGSARSGGHAEEASRRLAPNPTSRLAMAHAEAYSRDRWEAAAGLSLEADVDGQDHVTRTPPLVELLRQKGTALPATAHAAPERSTAGHAAAARISRRHEPGHTLADVDHKNATDPGSSARAPADRELGPDPLSGRPRPGDVPLPNAHPTFRPTLEPPGPPPAVTLRGETPFRRRRPEDRSDEPAVPHAPRAGSPSLFSPRARGETPASSSDAATDAPWPALPTMALLRPDPVLRDLEVRDRRARLRREQVGTP